MTIQEAQLPTGSDVINTQQPATLLSKAGKTISDIGYAVGQTGNLSVRVGSSMLITPSGARLGDLGGQAMSAVNFDGQCIEGPAPSKEAPLHAAVYTMRPDINAVVHLHSDYATAVACQRPFDDTDAASALPPITPYFVMRVGRVPLLPFAPPGSPELVEEVLRLPLKASAALLANHGSLAFGKDVAEATEIAIELEAAAKIYLLSQGPNQRWLTSLEIAALRNRFPIRWHE